ncbi:imelysin family protein [Chitinivorax sp. B]|uniref:imelysin family protein n=1 Tax=Chitinivorax sp. B TaxID=2502235 RepID=UPI0010F74118|nr:imelysin family protein [Chitinivorax sp. B]
MRIKQTLLLLPLLASLTWAADEEPSRPEALPKAMLLSQMADTVLPSLHTALTDRAIRLLQTTRQACPAPDVVKLQQVRQAWRETARAWAAMEVFQIGPVIERRTARQIDGWPTRPKLLQPLLDGGTLDAERIDQTGSAGKGLPALEYLLFPEKTQDQAVARNLKGRPCQVLVALADGVKREAVGIQHDWKAPNGGFANQLGQAGKLQDGMFANEAQALGDMVNLLIAGIDYVRLRKLEKPLDKSTDEVALDRVEAWRSGESTRLLEANLAGFARVFFGHGLHGIGLDDYLLGIEKPILVRRVREQLAATQAAVTAIGMPIDHALADAPERVKAAQDALRKLQHLLEVDLADALQVDLSFNANDGD